MLTMNILKIFNFATSQNIATCHFTTIVDYKIDRNEQMVDAVHEIDMLLFNSHKEYIQILLF